MIAVALLALSLTKETHQITPSMDRHVASARAAVDFQHLSQSADRARAENRQDEAIQLYKRALALRPTWQEGLWYLGTLLYENDQYADARDVLRRFLAHDAKVGPGWALLGLSEFQTREYPRALDHLQRAMALGMGERKEMVESVFYFVAVLLTRFERYDDSLDLLFRMVASGQEQTLLVEPAGLAALRMPLLPAEIPADRHEMVHMAGTAALALEALQQHDAEVQLTKMADEYRKEPGVHFLLGAVLINLRPEDGIQEMKRELEISPSHVPARLRLAEEYLKENRLEEALLLAEEAIKLDPKRASAHLTLGEVLVAKGDLARAIHELETAREEAPQMVNIRWDLLRAYTAAGRPDDANREKDAIEKLSRQSAGQ